MYDFTPTWRAGFRLDCVAAADGGHHEEEEEGDDHDHEEEEETGDVIRLSPMIGWRPSEFTKFRLQYNTANQNTAMPCTASGWVSKY